MKLLQTLLCAVALCTFVATTNAAPTKEITLEEALNTDIFTPKGQDKIPAAPDKVVGEWSWENAEKDDSPDNYPSHLKPWKDKKKIEELISKMDGILSGDPRKTKAAQVSLVFPGVPGGENGKCDIIERQVEIDPRIGGWHSLGLYAPPGQKITATVNGKAKFDMSLRIGCHSDSLTWKQLEDGHDGTLKRPPKMTNSTRLKAGDKKAELANPFGGLVYLDVHGFNDKAKPVRVTISGATMSPLFILGKKDAKGVDTTITTAEEWAKQLKESKAPWAELQSPRITLSFPREMFKIMKNPRQVARRIQRCLAAQDWLIAWDMSPGDIATPMRFVIDQQISVGWGHSGYPTMGYYPWADPFTSGDFLKGGHWGLWHEIGHNHQRPPFVFDDCGEITVNLFSAVAQTQALAIPYERAWEGTSIGQDYFKKDVVPALKSGTSFDKQTDGRVKLYFFIELMRSFGYDAFRKVAIEHHKEKPFGNKTTNRDRWDFFLVALSNAVKRNLTPYFELWKIDISEGAKNKVKKFPDWLPCEGYPDKLPVYAIEQKAAAEKAERHKEAEAKKKAEEEKRKSAERRERAKKILESI
ncbi:MAG: M60 family metallopeptidase [Opitutae bacterium]|nr:M60 family metallopeptidase [Opitutae bacterium]